jgi:hypothetical protein
MPAIVVVNTTSPAPQQVRSPVIVVTRNRYRSSGSIFGSILTLLIIFGVYWYVMKVRNNVTSSINAAEHAAERAAEHAAPAAEHKKK